MSHNYQPELVRYLDHKDVRVGAYAHSVAIIFWRGQTTAAAVHHVRDAVLAMTQRNRRICLITVVERDAPLPAPEARHVIAHALSVLAGHLAASAVVVEGEGFSVAAARSVITGLNLLARPWSPFCHRAFATTMSASAWLLPHMEEGEEHGAAGLAAAVSMLRQ